MEVKVRKLIDGLPFTEEGYNKVKDILGMQYGQTSEVVGAYVQKILELPCTQQVDFTSTPAVLMKRGILAYLAKVLDPLGLLSPMLLEGKILYREVCEAKVRWDGFITDNLSKCWRKWESALPRYLSFPCSVPTY